MPRLYLICAFLRVDLQSGLLIGWKPTLDCGGESQRREGQERMLVKMITWDSGTHGFATLLVTSSLGQTVSAYLKGKKYDLPLLSNRLSESSVQES